MPNRAARIAALVVLILGGFVVLKPVVTDWGSLYGADPFAQRRTTVVTEKRLASGKREVTRVTKDASDSMLTRGLSAGGLLLVRVGIVVLVAFLAGALVQRLLLGEFAVKVGPLEVPALADAAATSERLAQELAALRDSVTEQQRDLASLHAQTSEGLELVSRALAQQATAPQGGTSSVGA